MTQVTNVEPEALSRIEPEKRETAHLPQAGSIEHAALVDAIRLNFPEIYEAPDYARIGRPYGESAGWNSPVSAPSSAEAQPQKIRCCQQKQQSMLSICQGFPASCRFLRERFLPLSPPSR